MAIAIALAPAATLISLTTLPASWVYEGRALRLLVVLTTTATWALGYGLVVRLSIPSYKPEYGGLIGVIEFFALVEGALSLVAAIIQKRLRYGH